jgi:hypothetical protein
MKFSLICFIFMLSLLFIIKPVWGQSGNDYVYFKNFVTHEEGELCTHIPPATAFTAYINNDQSKVLLENSPCWEIGAEPNIAGNGTFGVELGNFRDPEISAGDSVFVCFTCNATGQQGLLKSQVTSIPWYYFPVFLNLQLLNLPMAPQNITLSKDSSTAYRQLSWTPEPGVTYNLYRRSYSDTLLDGRSRMLYELISSEISGNSYTDTTTIANERYGYILFAVSSSGIKSSHSEEVNEDPYVRPGLDLSIKYITRMPRIPYVWGSENPAVEGWPAVNSTVTWRAVIKNWADSSLTGISYWWTMDGIMVDSGEIDIAAEDTAVVEYLWSWTFKRHELRFILDPLELIAEEEEENNDLLLYTNAITAGFYVEQSVYDYFHQYQKELGVGANCWEDWAHRHIEKWNSMFAAAIFPDSPNGVLDRIRLDKITVVPDGALPLAGGLPSNNPNFNDRNVDLQWGFNVDLLNGSFYANHTSTSMNNPFYFEGSLLHELGHARYLIDLYGMNVHDDGNGNTVVIQENGQLIVGTPYMPRTGDAVYYTPIHGLMNGEYTWIDEYSTAALNLIVGHRAVLGNYNAPGNIGEFMQDLPLENQLLLKDDQGNALSNADVKVFRAAPQTGVWYGKYYDNIPDLQLSADSNGMVDLGHCPFSSSGTIVHTYGHSNSVLIIRVESGGKIGYGFLEVTAFNMEYWRENTFLGNYEMQFTLIDPNSIPGKDPYQPIEQFALFQNFPNPFNPRTEIHFQLPERSKVVLNIYNALGEKVKTLIHDETRMAGDHSLWWDGENDAGSAVASGIYFAELRAGNFRQTIKMMLLR